MSEIISILFFLLLGIYLICRYMKIDIHIKNKWFSLDVENDPNEKEDHKEHSV